MGTREELIRSKEFPKVQLHIMKGHFMTSHSHINYYVDMTMMKMRRSEALEAAKAIATRYSTSTIVDTIICMDGCEVIGAYLAGELEDAGIRSMNAHKTIYVVSPEFNSTGQIIFRQNLVPMIENKNVLLLLGSTTTGKTLMRCLNCIDYYGGHVSGITSIFSTVTKAAGIPVHSLFQAGDLPDYKIYDHEDCAFCKQGIKIDAMVNGYGYSTF